MKGFVIMECKNLFPLAANGYDCEAVEKYIEQIKVEYQKVYNYAQKTEEARKETEANNAKLKKMARILKKENDSLKGKTE